MARQGSFVPSALKARDVALLWEDKANREPLTGWGREEGHCSQAGRSRDTHGLLASSVAPWNQCSYFNKPGWLL